MTETRYLIPVVLCALSACGYTGDLYLPEPQNEPEVATEPATDEDADDDTPRMPSP